MSMFRPILLLTLLWAVACQPPEGLADTSPATPTATDTASTAASPNRRPTIKLPVIGTLDFNRLSLDSARSFHTPNCSHVLSRHSMKRQHVAVDSARCDNGEKHTFYLLNHNDFPRIVYNFELSTFQDSEGQMFFFKEERVTDFTTDSIFIMIRTDTTSNPAHRTTPINKTFEFQTLGDQEAHLTRAKHEYLELWQAH